MGSEEVLAVGFSHENNEEDSWGQFYEPGRREFCGWWLTPYRGAGRSWSVGVLKQRVWPWTAEAIKASDETSPGLEFAENG